MLEDLSKDIRIKRNSLLKIKDILDFEKAEELGFEKSKDIFLMLSRGTSGIDINYPAPFFVTIKNKDTEQTAEFTIRLKREGSLSPYTIKNYDLTLIDRNGKKEEITFFPDDKEGTIPNVKEAICILENQIQKTKEKQVKEEIPNWNEEDIKKQEYEEAVMREQNEFKNSPEFEEEIKSISKCLGFSEKINFEGKLRETLLNKNDTDNFSIPIVLENKKTGDTASFNVKISYVIQESITKIRPTLFDYDLTLKKKNGEEKTMNFDFSNGKMINAKDAIYFLEKEIELNKKEEIYAYLVDDYGFETDISSRIRKITEEDIDRNRFFHKNEEVYKTQFMVDVYGETNLKGTLVTNAIHVECNESSISGIEAPKAEVINCAYCDNIEEIKAPNCKEIYCENSRLLKEENMELHPDCNIDGLREIHQLKR